MLLWVFYFTLKFNFITTCATSGFPINNYTQPNNTKIRVITWDGRYNTHAVPFSDRIGMVQTYTLLPYADLKTFICKDLYSYRATSANNFSVCAWKLAAHKIACGGGTVFSCQCNTKTLTCVTSTWLIAILTYILCVVCHFTGSFFLDLTFWNRLFIPIPHRLQIKWRPAGKFFFNCFLFMFSPFRELFHEGLIPHLWLTFIPSNMICCVWMAVLYSSLSENLSACTLKVSDICLTPICCFCPSVQNYNVS